MLTSSEEELLREVYDTLLKLYELRRAAIAGADWERVNIVEGEIARAEAQRKVLRECEGGTNMTKITNREQRRHIREKSIIDHVAHDLFEPAKRTEKKAEHHLSPTTSTGLPVEEQVRKEWNPRKGGLPTF